MSLEVYSEWARARAKQLDCLPATVSVSSVYRFFDFSVYVILLSACWLVRWLSCVVAAAAAAALLSLQSFLLTNIFHRVSHHRILVCVCVCVCGLHSVVVNFMIVTFVFVCVWVIQLKTDVGMLIASLFLSTEMAVSKRWRSRARTFLVRQNHSESLIFKCCMEPKLRITLFGIHRCTLRLFVLFSFFLLFLSI